MPRMLRGGPLRFLSRGPRCLLAQPELAVAGLPSLRSGLEVISEAPRPSFLVVPSARPPAFHSRRHELQAARVAASARLAAVATVAAPARDGPRPAPGQRLLPARPGAGQLLHRREEEQRVQGGGGLSGGPRWERGLGAGGGVAVGGVAFPSRAGRGGLPAPGALSALAVPAGSQRQLEALFPDPGGLRSALGPACTQVRSDLLPTRGAPSRATTSSNFISWLPVSLHFTGTPGYDDLFSLGLWYRT